MSKATNVSAGQMCLRPGCTDHPSWLRPVTERRMYAAASRLAS